MIVAGLACLAVTFTPRTEWVNGYGVNTALPVPGWPPGRLEFVMVFEAPVKPLAWSLIWMGLEVRKTDAVRWLAWNLYGCELQDRIYRCKLNIPNEWECVETRLAGVVARIDESDEWVIGRSGFSNVRLAGSCSDPTPQQTPLATPNPVAVPEPSIGAQFVVGLAGLLVLRRRRSPNARSRNERIARQNTRGTGIQ